MVNTDFKNIKPLTSNFELINLCNKYNVPLDAVIYKDQLKDYDEKTCKSFILDLHDSTDTTAGHWTGLYKNKDSEWVYFDPFGIIYPLAIKRFCKKNIEWNNEQIQSYYTGFCGYYCFLFLFYMSRGYDLKYIQDQFSQFE